MNFINEDRVRVYRCRPDAKLPVRAHKTDAGLDFFFCPENNIQKEKVLSPGTSALFPTGIKMAVPRGCMLQIMNKSGIASKKQLVTGACVVDEGYTGEIFVNLHNIGNEAQAIEPGQKIAQGVFIRIEKPILWEVREENIYGKETSRGEGSLGSTGEV
jgi:dUTP pyrophosphatase